MATGEWRASDWRWSPSDLRATRSDSVNATCTPDTEIPLPERLEADGETVMCRAERCDNPAVGRSAARKRTALCRECSKLDSLVMRGVTVRFCSSCKSVHAVNRFTGQRKNCDNALARARERKHGQKSFTFARKATAAKRTHPEPSTDDFAAGKLEQQQHQVQQHAPSHTKAQQQQHPSESFMQSQVQLMPAPAVPPYGISPTMAGMMQQPFWMHSAAVATDGGGVNGGNYASSLASHGSAAAAEKQHRHEQEQQHHEQRKESAEDEYEDDKREQQSQSESEDQYENAIDRKESGEEEQDEDDGQQNYETGENEMDEEDNKDNEELHNSSQQVPQQHQPLPPHPQQQEALSDQQLQLQQITQQCMQQMTLQQQQQQQQASQLHPSTAPMMAHLTQQYAMQHPYLFGKRTDLQQKLLHTTEEQKPGQPKPAPPTGRYEENGDGHEEQDGSDDVKDASDEVQIGAEQQHDQRDAPRIENDNAQMAMQARSAHAIGSKQRRRADKVVYGERNDVAKSNKAAQQQSAMPELHSLHGKLLKRTPDSLPDNVLDELKRWWGTRPMSISSIMRPGCVQLTIDACLPPDTHLGELPAESTLSRFDRLRVDTLQGSGDSRKECCSCSSVCKTCGKEHCSACPRLRSATPVCALPHEQLVVHGCNLSSKNVYVTFRCEGCAADVPCSSPSHLCVRANSLSLPHWGVVLVQAESVDDNGKRTCSDRSWAYPILLAPYRQVRREVSAFEPMLRKAHGKVKRQLHAFLFMLGRALAGVQVDRDDLKPVIGLCNWLKMYRVRSMLIERCGTPTIPLQVVAPLVWLRMHYEDSMIKSQPVNAAENVWRKQCKLKEHSQRGTGKRYAIKI